MLKVKEMAYAYEEELGSYLHRPALRFIKGKVDSTLKTYKHFQKAVELADQLSVDYPTYLQAQFYWFDKWFRRAPKPWELIGQRTKFPAPERVKEFLRLRSLEEAPQKVYSISRTAKIDPKKLDKINEQRLTELSSSWGLSEEEVLLRFARTGVGYFDLEWLRKNPTYKSLKRQKKL